MDQYVIHVQKNHLISRAVRRDKRPSSTGKLFVCNECKREFGRKQHLQRHQSVHTKFVSVTLSMKNGKRRRANDDVIDLTLEEESLPVKRSKPNSTSCNQLDDLIHRPLIAGRESFNLKLDTKLKRLNGSVVDDKS